MPDISKFAKTIDSKIPNGPNVILDVGSRDLQQSIQFKERYPKARVIAFEPNPACIKQCKKNKKKWDIVLMEFAVSDKEGTFDFWSVDVNIGGSSLLEPIDVPGSKGNKWNKIAVSVKRLDTVLAELAITEVDVVWMDVQGVELLALKGMGDYIHNVKCLHLEASPNPYYKEHILKNELEQFLTENNFAFKFVEPPKKHKYGEGDLICLKK